MIHIVYQRAHRLGLLEDAQNQFFVSSVEDGSANEPTRTLIISKHPPVSLFDAQFNNVMLYRRVPRAS